MTTPVLGAMRDLGATLRDIPRAIQEPKNERFKLGLLGRSITMQEESAAREKELHALQLPVLKSQAAQAEMGEQPHIWDFIDDDPDNMTNNAKGLMDTAKTFYGGTFNPQEKIMYDKNGKAITNNQFTFDQDRFLKESINAQHDPWKELKNKKDSGQPLSKEQEIELATYEKNPKAYHLKRAEEIREARNRKIAEGFSKEKLWMFDEGIKHNEGRVNSFEKAEEKKGERQFKLDLFKAGQAGASARHAETMKARDLQSTIDVLKLLNDNPEITGFEGRVLGEDYKNARKIADAYEGGTIDEKTGSVSSLSGTISKKKYEDAVKTMDAIKTKAEQGAVSPNADIVRSIGLGLLGIKPEQLTPPPGEETATAKPPVGPVIAEIIQMSDKNDPRVGEVIADFKETHPELAGELDRIISERTRLKTEEQKRLTPKQLTPEQMVRGPQGGDLSRFYGPSIKAAGQATGRSIKRTGRDILTHDPRWGK